MQRSDNNHSHNSTTTTMKVKASAMGYSCVFFCQRQTNDDVLDPADSYRAREEEKQSEEKQEEPKVRSWFRWGS